MATGPLVEMGAAALCNLQLCVVLWGSRVVQGRAERKPEQILCLSLVVAVVQLERFCGTACTRNGKALWRAVPAKQA